MPKYLLLLQEDEAMFDADDEVMFNEVMSQHRAFSAAVAERGAKILGGEALQPVATATFLRRTRTPEVAVVDNPTPDLKEVLGGYYVIETADEAEALELAKLCPSGGYVEVRPVWEFD